MRISITITLLVTLCLSALGQRAEIRGSVLSKDSLKPIKNLDVVLFEDSKIKYGHTTDSNGVFEISNVYPGKYELFIFLFDDVVYKTKIDVSAGETLTLYELKIGTKAMSNVIEETVVRKPRGSEDITKIVLGEGDPFGPERGAIGKTQINVKTRNGTLEVGLGRPGGTVSFINSNIGMIGPAPRTFAGLSGVEVIDKGVPARYGNFTGGGVRYQVKEIGITPENYYQVQSTSPFDGYHHNLGVMYFSRALLTRSHFVNDQELKAMKLGISLQANYKFQADPNPNNVRPYVLTDASSAVIEAEPLVSSELIGGYVPSATFLENSDLTQVSARPNARRHDFGGRMKISYAPNDRFKMDLVNSFDYTNRRLSQSNYVPMNSSENPLQEYRFINSQLKLSHKVIEPYNGKGESQRDSQLLSKLSYEIDLNYQQSNSEVSSYRHKDNFFNYGHVGAFHTVRVPTYDYVEEGQTKFVDENGDERLLKNYMELTGYRDSLVGFQPGASNPSLGEYTSFFYDKLGSNGSFQDLISIGGLSNGQNIPLLYSLYANPGTVYGNYSKSFQKRFSASATTYLSLHPHKNHRIRHDIEFGMNFQQDISGSYNLNASQLWQLMPLLANSHLQNVDRANPIFKTDYKGRFTDTITYPTFVDAESQKTFDKNLRDHLVSSNYVDANGNAVTENSFIDINAIEPHVFQISMFSADELLNNGNPYVSYAGYDHTGKRTNKRYGLQRFLTDKENRPIDAFAPINAAAWLQDKLVLKSLIIRAGIRFERYDGNQYVLKDPYSVYPIKQVSEVEAINGIVIDHPESVKDDYVVYVDDAKNPNKIIGYRDGSNWYDQSGNPISDPNFLANQSSSGRIQPMLVDPENQELTINSFKKFEAQNIFLPRLSVSFPLNTSSLFFMSYDKLAQNPSAGQTYLPYTSYYYLQSNLNGVLPNPELKARVKTEYNIGFSQAIGLNAGIKVSAAYANIANDVNQIRIEQAYPYSYTSYGNVDFSTIKRYMAEYDYVGRHLSIQASYALQFADGTGSNANSAATLIQSGQPNLRSLFPLVYDNRHTFKSGVSFRFGGDSTVRNRLKYKGPQIGKYKLCKDVVLSASMQSISGTPYTAVQRAISEAQAANGVVQRSQTKGNPFGSRMPWTHNVDLNIQRDFNWAGKTVSIYMLVNNILNTKLIANVYSYTGQPDDDGYLNSPHGIQATQNQIDAETFAMLYKLRMDNPGNFGTPRMVNIGAKLNF